jgi:hypothetical protein
MMDTPREAFCKELTALKARRSPWEAVWSDLGDHIVDHRGRRTARYADHQQRTG